MNTTLLENEATSAISNNLDTLIEISDAAIARSILFVLWDPSEAI